MAFHFSVALRAVAVAALCACGSQAVADDCEDVGKLGTMLGQIDRQCSGYRLTRVGRRVMIGMAARSAPLGGEVCAAKGKVAMLQQLGQLYPKLGELAASGDTAGFNRSLCDAIATYLETVANSGGHPVLVERSN